MCHDKACAEDNKPSACEILLALSVCSALTGLVAAHLTVLEVQKSTKQQANATYSNSCTCQYHMSSMYICTSSKQKKELARCESVCIAH